MATTAVPINGSSLIIRLSEDDGTTWKIIGFAQSATLSRTMETRDITNKTSCGWKTLGEGTRSWDLSAEGFVTYAVVAGEINPTDFDGWWTNRTKIYIEFTVWDCAAGTVNSGDPNYKGYAYLTSFEETGGTEDNGMFSVAFEGTGELTKADNP